MKYDRRLQIRLDSNLHQQANDLYEKMGMDLATAIRLFLQQSVV
ncbi:type II toxin-antitoxin system RelB/DinJ family antitoxin, partial [bacterium]|nr:type II toxin-antitoxin system RelB/DinJ family antitoxin [bacterium]